MGFYSRTIFPCLCDLIMRQPILAKYRRDLLAGAGGNILEIGFGTGLNLPHYPEHVHKITTVDPNVGMHRKARKRIERTGIEVDQRVLDAARLPFDDSTFDSVVSTWTLCSIDNVNQALSEVYRVLKPGGRFLFLEHGLSPEPKVQKWQRRLNWLEMCLADGCRLDRNIKELVAAQPFASARVEEFYLEQSPKTHAYMYRGIASKSL
jgi:ubiquinone/menaquinone biosynthesis C-methylase UbiE